MLAHKTFKRILRRSATQVTITTITLIVAIIAGIGAITQPDINSQTNIINRR